MLTGDGANLSQGQRQLPAIACAAAADPPVLILDEANSSIDARTEALVRHIHFYVNKCGFQTDQLRTRKIVRHHGAARPYRMTRSQKRALPFFGNLPHFL